MSIDPRSRNELFDTGSLAAYLGGYADRLAAALRAIDAQALEQACRAIEQTAGRARVFAIGNGGSAAIADHLCCDCTKGTAAPGHPVIDSLSLTANMPLYSALANDFGFEQVFSRQIDYFGRAGDVLLAVSSSGNSENIVAAVAAAKARGLTTIGLTGFDGGRLREAADIALHVPVRNYGVVEDAHQAVMHILAQFIAAKRDRST